jgi:DNA invertase Pin-like site-specific DNA recombinase
MTTFGYARVSTLAQDTVAQVEQLKSAGATRVFKENVSGARSDNRPELRKLLSALKPGDVFLVTAIDRAARNTRDLLNILDEVAKVGAKFKALSDPWLDTSSPTGELVLTVLAGVATLERHLIKSRTSEGRVRARARGVKFGRKPCLSTEQKRHVGTLRDRGMSLHEIVVVLKVSPSTVRRAIDCRRAA